jgi:hypothetical protein
LVAAHNQLLNAIKSGEAHLKHVETVDKSKPAIDASTHVGTVSFLAQLQHSCSHHACEQLIRSELAISMLVCVYY